MSLTECEYYVLLFFVGSVFGWCMEVACKLVQFRRFINRGFLIGPYCPIYGFGAVSLTVLLSRFREDPFAVFALAMVICGNLEYLTSVLMEKLFHARWWDYSNKKFNLNGRVCANTLIPFGLLGLGMIYFVKPFAFGLFARLPLPALHALCIGLTGVLLTDAGVSLWALIRIRRGAEQAEGDSTEAITASVCALLQKEGILVRRALRAFPDARLYNSRLVKRLKTLRREQKALLRQARQAVKQKTEELKHEG